jgi:hypothetical protein
LFNYQTKSNKTMNVQELATTLNVEERTIRGKLEKAGAKVLNGSPVGPEWIAYVCEEYKSKRKGRAVATNVAARQILSSLSGQDVAKATAIKHSAPAEAEPRQRDWADYLALAPLPILGLVASYGVFSFAAMFVPMGMAVVEAVSFEAIYIALAAIQGLNDAQQERAKKVSIGALIVSALYGSLAAVFHLSPVIRETMPLAGEISMAVLHGVPVPLLAYHMANLLLHREN